MAFLQQANTTVIAYGNKVTAANISTIAITGSSTVAPGFPITNLAYDDPHRILKVTAQSANVVIDITFASAQTFNCAGVVNHNMIFDPITGAAKYTGFLVAYSGVFTPVGTTLTLSGTRNHDFLTRFDAQTSTEWRFIFSKASAWPPFYLGMLFLGAFYSCPRQPVDGGISTIDEAQFIRYLSAGGVSHVVAGGTRPRTTGELLFERVNAAQAQQLVNVVGADNNSRVICVIPPDEAGTDFPAISSAHKFARILETRHRPRVGSPTSYDVTFRTEGIVA